MGLRLLKFTGMDAHTHTLSLTGPGCEPTEVSAQRRFKESKGTIGYLLCASLWAGCFTKSSRFC